MFLVVKRALAMVPGTVWMAVIAIALSVGGWVINERTIDLISAERDSAKAAANRATEQRDAWMASAAERTAALESTRLERAAAEAAVRDLQQRLADRSERYRAQRRRIGAAPADEDAPVAPVLRDTLESLP